MATDAALENDRQSNRDCDSRSVVHVTNIRGDLFAKGLIVDQSAEGIGIQLDNVESIAPGGILAVTTYEGRQYGEVCHITSLEKDFVVGLRWTQLSG